MKLNNKWGYGQLFGYSALEGPNRYYDDNILMTMKKKYEFRFEYRPYWISITFPNTEKYKVEYLMSDFFVAGLKDKLLVLTFVDNDTLEGICQELPVFKGEKRLIESTDRDVQVYHLDKHYLGFKYVKDKEGYKFVIHHSFSSTEARSGANYYLKNLDVAQIIENKIAYYQKLPFCVNKKYERLYYKALSVNKVNVRSPEGKIDSLWTTPDRVPHRHMWMWDSAFHALAMSEYNMPVAEEILLAMLKQTRNDGFMPHMANPTDCSDVTQPCVMSYAVFELYQKSKNLSFLEECVPYLEKYLTYDLRNRDKNNNGLLEWLTEPDYENCKCGESGQDNSPRFDFDLEMDCVDFSTFFALDALMLSNIYNVLSDIDNMNKWLNIYEKTSQLINKLLWDEEDGVYYDRLFNGKLTKVLTPSSFLPLLANIPSKEQAERMVKVLLDDKLLWSKAPIASISQKDKRFSNDMWRGGVWVNINYLMIISLKKFKNLLNY